MQKSGLAIFLSTIWVSICEVFRNSFLLHQHWVTHFDGMQQVFPEQPINGVVWGIWAFVFSTLIFIINQRFSFWETAGLAWVIGFVLMWLVIGNLGVLPLSILPFAIPLSMVEVIGSVWIYGKVTKS